MKQSLLQKLLKTILKHERWKQADLAFSLGVDPSQVSRWLTNKALPKYEVLVDLMNFFPYVSKEVNLVAQMRLSKRMERKIRRLNIRKGVICQMIKE